MKAVRVMAIVTGRIGPCGIVCVRSCVHGGLPCFGILGDHQKPRLILYRAILFCLSQELLMASGAINFGGLEGGVTAVHVADFSVVGNARVTGNTGHVGMDAASIGGRGYRPQLAYKRIGAR